MLVLLSRRIFLQSFAYLITFGSIHNSIFTRFYCAYIPDNSFYMSNIKASSVSGEYFIISDILL
jgi:hypothetical protein